MWVIKINIWVKEKIYLWGYIKCRRADRKKKGWNMKSCINKWKGMKK